MSGRNVSKTLGWPWLIPKPSIAGSFLFKETRRSKHCASKTHHSFPVINEGTSWHRPAKIPMMDPIAACKQIRGEEMNRAARKMPPVQGLSQPYTWPMPMGMAFKSCGHNRDHKLIVEAKEMWTSAAKPLGTQPSRLTFHNRFSNRWHPQGTKVLAHELWLLRALTS